MYDPVTGRFLQPDPVHTERPGFDSYDRYQYVNGNPVNFIDPTGESWLKNPFGKVIDDLKGWSFKKTMTNIGKSMVEGPKKFWKNNRRIITALVCPPCDPMFWMGAAWTALNLAIAISPAGMLINYTLTGKIFPSIQFKGGAMIVIGAPLNTLTGGAVTLGPFVNAPANVDEATIQHELAHVQQYNEWGGWKYLSHTWKSPSHALSGWGSWAENDADRRASTAGYNRQKNIRNILLMYVLLNKDPSDNFMLLLLASERCRNIIPRKEYYRLKVYE